MTDQLPKMERALDDLRRDGRMTDRDWAVIDEGMQHAILKAAASLLRGRRKAA